LWPAGLAAAESGPRSIGVGVTASSTAQGPEPAGWTDDCRAVIRAEQQAYEVQNRFLARHRQLLRVGEQLRTLRCPGPDAQEPVFTPAPASAGRVSAPH
jgi:hypothetical protein